MLSCSTRSSCLLILKPPWARRWHDGTSITPRRASPPRPWIHPSRSEAGAAASSPLIGFADRPSRRPPPPQRVRMTPPEIGRQRRPSPDQRTLSVLSDATHHPMRVQHAHSGSLTWQPELHFAAQNVRDRLIGGYFICAFCASAREMSLAPRALSWRSHA